MNGSEVRKLKDGDEVKFVQAFMPFTVGKKYKVRLSEIGAYIDDDNGRGRKIFGSIDTEIHFEKVVKIINVSNLDHIKIVAKHYREVGKWNVILCKVCGKVIKWDKGNKGLAVGGPSKKT